MNTTIIKLVLSARERYLITEYGYPFEELAQQLVSLEGKARSASVTIDSFYLDQLLGYIVISAKEIADEMLLEELDALYTEIEMQARSQGYRG